MFKSWRFALVLLSICLAGALISGADRLLADDQAVADAPGLINYQGFLTDSGGSPLSTTVTLRFTLYDADTGGTNLWQETHSNVSVNGGHFSLVLGSINPLTTSLFSSETRYLETSVDTTNTNSNFTDLPRQRFTSVPYAMQANAVPWNGITSMPSGFADGVDDTGGAAYENVVVVAKSGGDYDSIKDAMDAISPSSSSPYLIYVAPGTYDEQVVMKEYVHLKGAGPYVTMISTSVTGDTHAEESAVVSMGAYAQLSDISVINTGNTGGNADGNSIAVRIKNGNMWTALDNVRAAVAETGGARHIAVYTSSGQSSMSRVYAMAAGANEAGAGGGNNWALFNNAHDATIDSSEFRASNNNANGIRMNGGEVTVTNSKIWGGDDSNARGISNNGSTYVYHSTIYGQGSAVIQTTSNSNEIYIGASKVDGSVTVTFGTKKCAQSYKGDYTELSAACN
ncbi:MAG: hypothetical protein KDD92_01850 [Caldilineaceae bacterium]|nr:hypothetical protein [Caldilineaceae bacterium]